MIQLPRISNHGSEIALLGLISMGVVALLWRAIDNGFVGDGFDVAAFLLILQRIIEAVQGRWTQRGLDQANDNLSKSQPQAMQKVEVMNDRSHPVPTRDLPEPEFGFHEGED